MLSKKGCVLKRVCFLTSVHQALDSRIFYKECTSLAEDGFRVTLIAQNDCDEYINGVRIKAVKKQERRISRLIKTNLQILYKAFRENADVYHLHDPELILVGLILKILGKRVIYDVHEDYPSDVQIKRWIPSHLRKAAALIVGRIEEIAANNFDGIIVVTHSLLERFPSERTILVRNYPSVNEYSVLSIDDYRKRKNFLVYFGGLTVSRGLREMVTAVGLMPGYLEATLVLAGKYDPPGIEVEIMKLEGWKRVEYLGWLSKSQMDDVLARAKIGLVLLHPNVYWHGLPTKLFEYMSAAIPVIASKHASWSSIVKDSKCGVLVDSYNPEEIADAILSMLRRPEDAYEMGINGREAVESIYNWRRECEKLLDLYFGLFN